MTFGKWLVEKRQALNLTQSQLAERVGVSANYISALERDEPNAKDGSPRRPRIDKVDRLAKALRVSRDDARMAAGYAPATLAGPPTTKAELLAAIERLGVSHIEFEEDIEESTPEELAQILNAVRVAVEVTLSQQRKK